MIRTLKEAARLFARRSSSSPSEPWVPPEREPWVPPPVEPDFYGSSAGIVQSAAGTQRRAESVARLRGGAP